MFDLSCLVDLARVVMLPFPTCRARIPSRPTDGVIPVERAARTSAPHPRSTLRTCSGVRCFRAFSRLLILQVFFRTYKLFVNSLCCRGLVLTGTRDSVESGQALKHMASAGVQGTLASGETVEEAGGGPSGGSGKVSSWAERISISSQPPVRAKMKYFELVLDGSSIVVAPPPEVLEEGSKKWKNCLVGHLFDSKLPQAVVRSITLKIWAKFGIMEVIPHVNRFFIFRFSQPSTAKEVLEGRPWLISGRHIFLRWWTIGLRWQKHGVSKVPVWVQFFFVPMKYWTRRD